MRWSVALPAFDAEPSGSDARGADPAGWADAVADAARAAEAAGFDACFVTDHPAPPDRWLAAGGHHALDPFVALSFAAAATRRLRMQTHVLVAAYRNPLLTAKAAASLDVLSGGRLILGLAAGYLEGEFSALGVDFARRNELADEAIEVIRRAWTETGLDVRGLGFRAEGVTQRPRPVQRPHPPIWVGGNSRRAIRRAVELGDGWLPFPAPPRMASHIRTASIATRADLEARLDYAREHAARVGRERPLDVCFVPFGLGMSARARADAERLREDAAALERVGVTWCTVSLPARSRSEWGEAAARFGARVIRAGTS